MWWYRYELKIAKIKDNSMKIEDVEDSMHNIWNQGEITKIKGINRSSKVVRLEESKLDFIFL